MEASRSFGDRWGWWWIRWVMMAFHVILTICSFALLIFLSTMESRMPPHNTPDFGFTIFMALLSTIYGLVGVMTFWRPTYTWARVLASFSVFLLLFFYLYVGSLHYQSAICGIDRFGNETLIVTFNETEIQNCTWQSDCLLSFPDSIFVQCPTLPSFWWHVHTLRDKSGRISHFANKFIDTALLYHMYFLIVMYLSLILSMLLGFKETMYTRPAAFRSSVPITSILWIPHTVVPSPHPLPPLQGHIVQVNNNFFTVFRTKLDNKWSYYDGKHLTLLTFTYSFSYCILSKCEPLSNITKSYAVIA